MALFTYKGVDYDTPAYPVQDNASATSLTPGSVPTGRTIDNVYSTKYMEKGVDYVTAGDKQIPGVFPPSYYAIGTSTTIEGSSNIGSTDYSHIEGSSNSSNKSSGTGTHNHVEGYGNEVTGSYNHIEGYQNAVTGNHNHAEGRENEITANYAHVEGHLNIAASYAQHVIGQGNVEDSESKYVFIIGNGTPQGMGTVIRSNAFAISWYGDAYAGRSNGIDITNEPYKLPTSQDVVSYVSSNFLPSNHTYACSIATDSGTNQLTLAFGTKYKLTAGGSSYIFTMPDNTSVKDYNNSTPTFFGYNSAGMAQSDATWLGAWDASVSGQYRLRAVKQADLVVANSAKVGGYSVSTAATANTVALRQGNGYLYAVYYNASNSSENIASYTSYPVFKDSNGWMRCTTKANLQSWLELKAMAYQNGDTAQATPYTNLHCIKIGKIVIAQFNGVAISAFAGKTGTLIGDTKYRPVNSANITGFVYANDSSTWTANCDLAANGQFRIYIKTSVSNRATPSTGSLYASCCWVGN